MKKQKDQSKQIWLLSEDYGLIQGYVFGSYFSKTQRRAFSEPFHFIKAYLQYSKNRTYITLYDAEEILCFPSLGQHFSYYCLMNFFSFILAHSYFEVEEGKRLLALHLRTLALAETPKPLLSESSLFYDEQIVYDLDKQRFVGLFYIAKLFFILHFDVFNKDCIQCSQPLQGKVTLLSGQAHLIGACCAENENLFISYHTILEIEQWSRQPWEKIMKQLYPGFLKKDIGMIFEFFIQLLENAYPHCQSFFKKQRNFLAQMNQKVAQ